MMPRRARQGVGVLRAPLQHREKRCLGETCGQRRNLIPAAPEGGAQSKLSPACLGKLLETREEGGWVDAGKILLRGGGGGACGEVLEQAGHLHQVHQSALGFRVLGQPTREGLNEATDRQG